MAAAPNQSVPQQPAIQQPGMMQQQTDPLAELRDIHQPGMIETWPPAFGWWVLAGLAVLGFLVLCFWLYRRWRANRYRREAIRELQSLHASWQRDNDDHAYLVRLQELLKRVALTSFPREEVASRTGEAWVRFLDRSTGSHDFSIGESEVLIDGNYRSDVTIDVPALEVIARQWIRKHHIKHLQQAQTMEEAA
jgi:hypothetical protein